MGKIGDGPWQEVGSGPTTLSGTGDLYLADNDNGYGDNYDSWTAAITPDPTHQLTVTKAGAGAGSVTSSPAGIDCGSSCAAMFATGSSVTLTAAPSSGSSFAGWSGACSNGGATCTVALDADRSVTATFVTSSVTRSQTAPTVTTGTPTVHDSKVTFAGTVTGDGLASSAYFQYGLDPRYGTLTGGPTAFSTTPRSLGADSAVHAVSASVSGLSPNTVYDVRLVTSTTGLGTTYGPERIFTVPRAAAPPPPILGKSFDLKPVSGLVLIKPPPGQSIGPVKGFVPLTQARRIPSGSQIDTLKGKLSVTAAPGAKHGRQDVGVFSGAVFKLTQARSGSAKGLTTLALVEGAFKGAPSYAACRKHTAGDPGNARIARLSSRVLQTLSASDHGSHFRSRGRYSAGTVRGTVWITSDRCDGTLTTVHKGVVAVTDLVRHITVILRAGHSYLAKPRP